VKTRHKKKSKSKNFTLSQEGPTGQNPANQFTQTSFFTCLWRHFGPCLQQNHLFHFVQTIRKFWKKNSSSKTKQKQI